ncbi:hypothetical protein FPOA_06767 [Fusarium poae]|uniref:NACHT domain-containing protein n=1 Tax=Fusarium poae TaxID=36050 RepID=A0A1B8AJA9_FUSPO|nr:hypothetical protein FPOA_06767 [Fusarium poae]
MKLVTTDLSTLLQGLRRKLPQNRPLTKEENTSEDDVAIDDLCRRCVEVAEELLLRVNKLKLQRRDEKSSGGLKNGVKGPKPLEQQGKSMENSSKAALKQQWSGLMRAADAGFEGSFKKWDSFRKALEASWSKGEIEALASTIREIRGEIEFRILVKLRTTLTTVVLQQSQFSHQLTQSTRTLLDNFTNTRDKLAHELKLQSERLIEMQNLGKLKTPQDIEEYLIGKEKAAGTLETPAGIQQVDQESFKPSTRDKQVEEQLRLLIVENGILTSLSFSTLMERKESLESPYHDTFEWIFEDPESTGRPWSSYISWLKEGNGIYWINGKAGSGKSTLMSYIYGNPKTTAFLNDWAGSMPSEIYAFFFWNSGDEDQKSQRGLLRTLLFQILQRHRDLIVHVMPEAWASWSSRATAIVSCNMPPDSPMLPPVTQQWTMAQLKRVFRMTLQLLQGKVKLCLFIDGLDEYNGDYLDLLELFQEYAQHPDIKFCLSSRPLLAFENEMMGFPSLRLQDLTSGDISHYVKDRLYRHKYMIQLSKQKSSDVTDLVDEIVAKASGVFLWVKLVVKSLIRGLSDYNRISDLQRRVKHLPGDLEALYTHMLITTDPFYHEQASQIFQIVRAAQRRSPNRLTLLNLSWADDEDESFAENAQIKPLGDEEVIERCRMMDARLKSVCAGLLESLDNTFADIAPDAKVVYLHRTVADWLEQPAVWDQIVSHTAGSNFSPNLSMLRSSLMQVKTAKVSPRFPLEEAIVKSALQFARDAEADLNTGFPKILDQLDFAMTCQQRIGKRSLHEELKRRSSAISDDSSSSENDEDNSNIPVQGTPDAGLIGEKSNFYKLAKEFGLDHYVSMKYDAGVIVDQNVNQHLLLHAVTHTSWPDLEAIKSILSNGVDSNFSFEGPSPWEQVLLRATNHFAESCSYP